MRGSAVLAPPSTGATFLRFLAVGRQGYENSTTGRISASMERAARERPTNAVLYLGDNFYPKGVSSVDDSQWNYKFEWLYSGAYLRGMPFFAVLGNHDHEGSISAQLQYSHLKRGTSRWQMDDRYYTRDLGSTNGRVLMRIVFLDTVALLSDAAQLQYLNEAFAAAGAPIWRVVVGHCGCRSLTNEPYTRRLTLSSLLPVLISNRVDLCLSANERFQQILDRPGEPLHVSANGGGDKSESGLQPENPGTDFVISQPGFAVLEVSPAELGVQLRDAGGNVTGSRFRRREAGMPSGST